MHISEGIIPAKICIGGYAITGLITWYSLRQINRQSNPTEGIPKAALLTAAFFVASGIHIPIPPASVHLVLNGLLGAVLGWYGFPAILVGLLFQAIMFGHGGLTTLGVNAIIMGVPALISAFIFHHRYQFGKQLNETLSLNLVLIPNFFVRKLCEGRNGNVFASVQYNGVIRTIDHGVRWNGFRFRPSYIPVDFLLKTDDGKIMSSTSQTSYDNGQNWIYSDYDFLPSSFAKNINGYIYATDRSATSSFTNGFYKSTNNGDDWTYIKVKNIYEHFQNFFPCNQIGSMAGTPILVHARRSDDSCCSFFRTTLCP